MNDNLVFPIAPGTPASTQGAIELATPLAQSAFDDTSPDLQAIIRQRIAENSARIAKLHKDEEDRITQREAKKALIAAFNDQGLDIGKAVDTDPINTSDSDGTATAALKRGAQQTLALGQMGLGALQNTFGDKAAADLSVGEARGNLNEAAAVNPERVHSVTDINSFGDLGDYITEAVVSNLPNLLVMGGTGGVGAAIGAGGKKLAMSELLQKAKATGKTAAFERLKRQSGNRAMKLGGATGAAVSDYALLTGEAYQHFQDQGIDDPNLAMYLGAATNTALDMMALGRALRPLSRKTGVPMSEMGSVVAKVAKESGTNFLTEGSTEGLQSIVNDITAKISSDDARGLNKEAFLDAFEQAIRGGIGGAATNLGTQALGAAVRSRDENVDRIRLVGSNADRDTPTQDETEIPIPKDFGQPDLEPSAEELAAADIKEKQLRARRKAQSFSEVAAKRDGPVGEQSELDFGELPTQSEQLELSLPEPEPAPLEATAPSEQQLTLDLAPTGQQELDLDGSHPTPPAEEILVEKAAADEELAAQVPERTGIAKMLTEKGIAEAHPNQGTLFEGKLNEKGLNAAESAPIPATTEENEAAAARQTKGEQLAFVQMPGEEAPSNLTTDSQKIIEEGETNDPQAVGAVVHYDKENEAAVEQALEQGDLGAVQNYGVANKNPEATHIVTRQDEQGRDLSPIAVTEEEAPQVVEANSDLKTDVAPIEEAAPPVIEQRIDEQENVSRDALGPRLANGDDVSTITYTGGRENGFASEIEAQQSAARNQALYPQTENTVSNQNGQLVVQQKANEGAAQDAKERHALRKSTTVNAALPHKAWSKVNDYILEVPLGRNREDGFVNSLNGRIPLHKEIQTLVEGLENSADKLKAAIDHLKSLVTEHQIPVHTWPKNVPLYKDGETVVTLDDANRADLQRLFEETPLKPGSARRKVNIPLSVYKFAKATGQSAIEAIPKVLAQMHMRGVDLNALEKSPLILKSLRGLASDQAKTSQDLPKFKGKTLLEIAAPEIKRLYGIDVLGKPKETTKKTKPTESKDLSTEKTVFNEGKKTLIGNVRYTSEDLAPLAILTNRLLDDVRADVEVTLTDNTEQLSAEGQRLAEEAFDQNEPSIHVYDEGRDFIILNPDYIPLSRNGNQLGDTSSKALRLMHIAHEVGHVVYEHAKNGDLPAHIQAKRKELGEAAFSEWFANNTARAFVELDTHRADTEVVGPDNTGAVANEKFNPFFTGLVKRLKAAFARVKNFLAAPDIQKMWDQVKSGEANNPKDIDIVNYFERVVRGSAGINYIKAHRERKTSVQGFYGTQVKRAREFVGLNPNPERLEARLKRAVRNPVKAVAVAVANTVQSLDSRLRRGKGPSPLKDFADMFYINAGSTKKQVGFLQSLDEIRGRWESQFARIIPNKNDKRAEELIAEAFSGEPKSTKAKQIKDAYDEYVKYLRRYIKSGLPTTIDSALPRVFDPKAVMENQTEVERLLRKAAEESALVPEARDEAVQIALAEVLAEPTISPAELHSLYPPGMPGHINQLWQAIPESDLKRLNLLAPKKAALLGFLHSATKRAEWERRFGAYETPEAIFNRLNAKLASGERVNRLEIDKYEALMESHPDSKEWNPSAKLYDTIAKMEPEQQAEALYAVNVYTGRTGANMNHKLRRGLSWAATTELTTTLALSSLASIPDLGGIMVRSKEFAGAREALATTLTAMKNPNEMIEFGRMIGVVNQRLSDDMTTMMYGQDYMDPRAKKFTETFFKYNGLQYVTNLSRSIAGSVAMDFISRHANEPSKHSKRYLEELGITVEDAKAWSENKNIWDSKQTEAQRKLNTKISRAIHRFVDQAIMKPNAAERPGWASHPVGSLVFLLKQFLWSYWKVIGTQIVNEGKARMASGDLKTAATPLAIAGMAYLPLAALSLGLRDIAKGREPDPEFSLKYFAKVSDRAGFYGPLSVAADLNNYGASVLGGPVLDHALELNNGVEAFIKRSIPVYSQF